MEASAMTNDEIVALRELSIAVLADRLYILGSDQWADPELVARWNADITPTTILELTRELAVALENVKDYKENSALFLRQRDEARTELAAALEINIKLVGAIDMIRETLNGGNVQDLLFIINNALGLYNDQRK